MPSRRFTPGGSLPPSCRYLWTASRPVNTTPEINTSSPTFSARIFSSVKGKVNCVIGHPFPKPCVSFPPFFGPQRRWRKQNDHLDVEGLEQVLKPGLNHLF